MKKILLALTLATLTAACADAPTAPARSASPEATSASSSSGFNMTAELQLAPDYPGGTWYFGVEMENYSSTNIFDYYFTWTDGLTVVREGYGMHTYTMPDNVVGGDIDLYVEVTGPDGYDWSQLTLWVGPWINGTRSITCASC